MFPLIEDFESDIVWFSRFFLSHTHIHPRWNERDKEQIIWHLKWPRHLAWAIPWQGNLTRVVWWNGKNQVQQVIGKLKLLIYEPSLLLRCSRLKIEANILQIMLIFIQRYQIFILKMPLSALYFGDSNYIEPVQSVSIKRVSIYLAASLSRL